MGQGSYCICELDSAAKSFPRYQQALKDLETKLLNKCATDWGTLARPKAFGKLDPTSDEFGRTPILPALFNDHLGVQMVTWRQLFTASGHQTIMTGTRAGNGIPEDFKVGIVGFMIASKNIHFTEFKMQIGSHKFGRLNCEELLGFNKPAFVLEEGFIINQEQSFELYGYIEGPIPTHHDGYEGVHQRIIPLGFAAYKVKDKVLGLCGAAI